MGLRERAIIDARKISTNKFSGPGVDLLLVSRKDNSVTASIVGIHTRHFLSVNSEGAITNDLNAHASFSESLLVEKNYPVRNARNLVDLKDDFLFANDSQGVNRKYKIAQAHPDETFGYIRVILEDCA